MSHPSPPIAGELVVVALKAEKLQHRAAKKQDPFCVFRVGDIIKRTKTDYGGGLYPIWDDQVNIPISIGQHELHIQLFDKTTSPSNLMAEGLVDLRKVLKEKEHDGYFPLSFRGKPGAGVIYLELTFYSAVNASRPQQQVRYQQPANYPPSSRPQYPPQHAYSSQHVYPPLQHQLQHAPLPPRPIEHHQAGLPHIPQQQPMQRPLSQYNSIRHTAPNQMRPLPHSQQQQHRPPPTHQQRPLPQPPIQQQHHPSAGTAQIVSPMTSAPQPLLSAPYNPVPSLAARPANRKCLFFTKFRVFYGKHVYNTDISTQ
ncbi:C2 domain-containing protein [Mycotypha africana]|uniref:C2 domain-containing protein n=1 Tax=Mycotypha africana TaxID=64632 RepID=UPI00230167B2|nr:C2 domain-containing protein [Mycotypha africana]KAI8979515.1 C2 domain-containing protein [Mycotypha africana]